eukprot:contig_25236_g6220
MTQEDLQLLQRRCRTDPASYAAEYETALRHYEALLASAFLFGMLTDPSEVLVKRSLHVLCDLYSRGVWADARTANVVAGALFHPSPTPAVVAARFLLGTWRRVGVHERVPPEELHPLIRALADNFVCDRSSVEAIATGLNAIRAVCARAPLAIMDPADGAAEEEAAEEEAA